MEVNEKKNQSNHFKFMCDSSLVTPASLLATLDQFLYHATISNDRRYFSHGRERGSGQEDDDQGAVQPALFLLQNLPPARNAALSYLAQALSKQVWLYMQSKEPLSARKDDNLVNQIEPLLTDLIENFPVVWCPMVARWAVNQLGRWSVEWEGVILSRDTTLEERVAGWLACRPAFALANLTVSCVAHDADNTVAALLEASIQCGPVLNWLVAHVGCSFPATIVNRVLSLGLRSFVAATSQNQANHQLASVDTILNHLAERYFPEIQCELQSVLLSTFSDSPDNFAKASVPFLLQLANANRSRAILRAITVSLPSLLQTSQFIPSLANQLSWWIPQYFPSTESLIDLLVHLLLDVRGPVACEIVFLLLESSLSQSSKQGNFTSQLLHYLLGELGSIAYMRRNLTPSRPHIPLLSSLGNYRIENIEKSEGSHMTISQLVEWALCKDKGKLVPKDKEVAARKVGQILAYVITEQGPESSSFILSSILRLECVVNKNSLFLLNCVMSTIVKHQSFFNRPHKTLTSILSGILKWNIKTSDILCTLQKLEAMLVGARLHNSLVNEALQMASMANISQLAKLINVPKLSMDVMKIITQLPLEKPIALGHLLCLGHTIVFYFLSSLKSNSVQNKLKIANLCNKILSQLSRSSLGHSLLIRLLFEATFRQEWSYFFGAKQNAFLEIKEDQTHLLKTNHQFDSWVKLPMSHNTIFHAGKVGKEYPGNQNKMSVVNLSEEEINFNTQLLLNIVGICCNAQGTSQGATTIALLLVEFVSPDIIFNGFPWPEENIKFTFERDLAIKKTFEDFSIAWHYLELIARCRPALCYCSVLVRALTAALTAFWSTCARDSAAQVPDQLLATRRLLEIMVVGQFLPEPFSVLPQMVNYLAPHEVVCILQDVWAYLRDQTPSPDRWVLLPNGFHQRPSDPLDPRYTDRCRKLILIHIDKFGHLLPAMLKNNI